MNSYSTDKKAIRKFGAIAFTFFGLLSGVALWRQKELFSAFLGTLSSFGLSLLVFPEPLRPVYVRWMQLAHKVGGYISITILAFAYYLVITPSALIKRVFGGRPIPIKLDKKVQSTWITRSEPIQPRERYLKRF